MHEVDESSLDIVLPATHLGLLAGRMPKEAPRVHFRTFYLCACLLLIHALLRVSLMSNVHKRRDIVSQISKVSIMLE